MSDRGLYRGVFSSLLDDSDFRRLSADAKLVFLTLRLSREAGPACIWQCDYPVLLAQLVARTGLPADRVECTLKELEHPEAGPWLLLDREAGVVWIRNGLRHDPSTRLAHANVRISVGRTLDGLPASPLIGKFRRHYGIRNGVPHGVTTASPGRPRYPSRNPISEQEQEKESEQEGGAGGGSLSRPGSDAQGDRHRVCAVCFTPYHGGPVCPRVAEHRPKRRG